MVNGDTDGQVDLRLGSISCNPAMYVSSNLSSSTVCIALSPCFLDKLDRDLGTPATSSV